MGIPMIGIDIDVTTYDSIMHVSIAQFHRMVSI